MLKETKDLLREEYGINYQAFDLYERSIEDIKGQFDELDAIREYNQYKVLKAFQEERISDAHFTNSTGYGYDDLGRDSLDKVYARVFNTESAILRPHFVNGTHALGAALYGALAPGEKMLSVCGKPYDTLHNVIGIGKESHQGSLKYYGIGYEQVDLNEDGKVNITEVKSALENDNSITLVHIQRSPGYSWRRALSIAEIEEVIKTVKSVREEIVVFVDNCYGEFVEIKEPTDVGADLIAGSLIKNVGGGISPSGGYVAGRKDLVENASFRLTIPGIGGECGATFGLMRTLFQGLFLAPSVTVETVKGAIFCARIAELCGFEALPSSTDKRSDIVQAIKFGDREKVIEFCKGIQNGSPIDSYVECEPWAMPGYDNDVIMAAGAFIQGASVELSADAPMREPYIAYMQGGLTFDHAKIGILIGISRVLKAGMNK